ncbi:hypothetical protein [Agromyces bauzanensis]
MGARRRRMAMIGIVCAMLALAGCSAGAGAGAAQDAEAKVDAGRIESELARIDGVRDAEVGVFNTGAPGSFGLRVELTVDDDGVARLGGVVVEAVRIVGRGSAGSGYSATLLVAAVDPGSPTGTRGVSLKARRAEIPIEVGTYQGAGLALTPDDLREAAGR